MNILIFYISFTVCFICYAIRTAYYTLANRGSKLVESKRFITVLLVVMFFLWFAWFCMISSDPYRMNLPSVARYTGLAFFVIGACFVILSHVKIRGQETDKLVTSGIYSKIRHPMYLGFIIWIIGFPIFMNAAFTLISGIIWIPQLLYWRISEERMLEKKYKGYQEYKRKTWF